MHGGSWSSEGESEDDVSVGTGAEDAVSAWADTGDRPDDDVAGTGSTVFAFAGEDEDDTGDSDGTPAARQPRGRRAGRSHQLRRSAHVASLPRSRLCGSKLLLDHL